jgi:hypothetical protein
VYLSSALPCNALPSSDKTPFVSGTAGSAAGSDFLEVRAGWSAIVAVFRGYRENFILIYVMSFSNTSRSQGVQNDEEGEGTCEVTPSGQLDKCNFQSFVYRRSLILGLVTFCTQLWEL